MPSTSDSDKARLLSRVRILVVLLVLVYGSLCYFAGVLAGRWEVEGEARPAGTSTLTIRETTGTLVQVPLGPGGGGWAGGPFLFTDTEGHEHHFYLIASCTAN